MVVLRSPHLSLQCVPVVRRCGDTVLTPWSLHLCHCTCHCVLSRWWCCGHLVVLWSPWRYCGHSGATLVPLWWATPVVLWPLRCPAMWCLPVGRTLVTVVHCDATVFTVNSLCLLRCQCGAHRLCELSMWSLCGVRGLSRRTAKNHCQNHCRKILL